MNLEDLAKKAIDEVSYEIKEQKEQSQELSKADKDSDGLDEDKMHGVVKELEKQEQVAIYSSEAVVIEEGLEEESHLSGEDIFLNKLKERILVLFEGLRATKDDDLSQRLQLTLTFLEFLLANIEEKLKK